MIRSERALQPRCRSVALRFLCEEYEALDWLKRTLTQEYEREHLRLDGTRDRTRKRLASESAASLSTCLVELLDDGTLLVDLINALIQKKLSSSTGRLPAKIYAVDTSVHSYRRVENVCAFLDSCKRHFGMKEEDLFDISDLLSDRRKDHVKVVEGIKGLAFRVHNLRGVPPWLALGAEGETMFEEAQIVRAANMLQLGILHPSLRLSFRYQPQGKHTFFSDDETSSAGEDGQRNQDGQSNDSEDEDEPVSDSRGTIRGTRPKKGRSSTITGLNELCILLLICLIYLMYRRLWPDLFAP